jgi:hypothetical protein
MQQQKKYDDYCHTNLSIPFDSPRLQKKIFTLHQLVYKKKPIGASFVKAALEFAMAELKLDSTIQVCILFGRPLPQQLSDDHVYVLAGTFQIVFLHPQAEIVFKVDKKIAENLAIISTFDQGADYLKPAGETVLAGYKRIIERCSTDQDRDALQFKIHTFDYAGSAIPCMQCNRIGSNATPEEKQPLIMTYLRELIRKKNRFVTDILSDNFAEGVCFDNDHATILKRPHRLSSQGVRMDDGYDSDISCIHRHAVADQGFKRYLLRFAASRRMPEVAALTRLAYAFMSLPREQTWFLSQSVLAAAMSLADMQSFFAVERLTDATIDNMYEFSNNPFPASLDDTLLANFKSTLRRKNRLFLATANYRSPTASPPIAPFDILEGADAAFTPEVNARYFTSLNHLRLCPKTQTWMRLVYAQISGRLALYPQTKEQLVAATPAPDHFRTRASDCRTLTQLFALGLGSKSRQKQAKGRRPDPSVTGSPLSYSSAHNSPVKAKSRPAAGRDGKATAKLCFPAGGVEGHGL